MLKLKSASPVKHRVIEPNRGEIKSTLNFDFLTSVKEQIKPETYLLDTSCHYVRVYFFYEWLVRDKNKFDVLEFFSRRLENIDHCLHQKPIFFDFDEALNYGRFLDQRQGILLAYVPEIAVYGQFHEILLKPGVLTKFHIHGCYPAWEQGKVYYQNPVFDENLLSLVESD